MGKIKKNKACGPDCLPIEVAKAIGDEGAIWMTGVLNEARIEGIPEEWRTSTIAPIYKQRGDPSEWNNFRGIILSSHTLKLWERVVEKQIEKNCQRSNHCSAYGRRGSSFWLRGGCHMSCHRRHRLCKCDEPRCTLVN